MKNINEMTLEELKAYRKQLLTPAIIIGSAYKMSQILEIDKRIKKITMEKK